MGVKLGDVAAQLRAHGVREAIEWKTSVPQGRLILLVFEGEEACSSALKNGLPFFCLKLRVKPVTVAATLLRCYQRQQLGHVAARCEAGGERCAIALDRTGGMNRFVLLCRPAWFRRKKQGR